jgi:hypothetical protein
VVEEVVVMEKKLVLVEEIHVRRKTNVRTEQIPGHPRAEQADIERFRLRPTGSARMNVRIMASNAGKGVSRHEPHRHRTLRHPQRGGTRAAGPARRGIARPCRDLRPQSERASALRQVDLTPDERANCEQKLAGGDHMLLAQVHTGEAPDHIIAVLERIANEGPERMDFAAEREAGDHVDDRSGAVSQQTVPVIEEELRVGTREVVRGGARVQTHVEDVPVQQGYRADRGTCARRAPPLHPPHR